MTKSKRSPRDAHRSPLFLARIVDFDPGGATCRVRVLDRDGFPTGPVVENVKLLPKLGVGVVDALAKQNVYYNSFRETVIE